MRIGREGARAPTTGDIIKIRNLILGLASLAMSVSGAYAQGAYKLTPEHMLYTALERGSHIDVRYYFTNLSDFPIWLWPVTSDSPQVIGFIGDSTDQAIFLGGAPPLMRTPLRVDPGQTHLSFVDYLFLAPNEIDGNDWGLTFYRGPSTILATLTDDVSGPRAPAGSADPFAIKILDLPELPEPASWAMMLGGFGLIGVAMRSRRKTAISFA